MHLKAAICDDEKSGIELICKHLESFAMETGNVFENTLYQNPEELLSDYTAAGKYDIIFLDVEMTVNDVMVSGIEVAKKIRMIPDPDVKIVFVSNYPAYMQMGFEVQASYYMEKEISFAKFNQVMEGIIASMQSDRSMFRIKTARDEWHLLNLKDILYARAVPKVRDRVVFHTMTQEFTEEGRSILSISEELCPYGFAVANKYHLVNMRHVLQFHHDKLQLDNQEWIEISRHYRKDFLAQFSDHILKL